jgi:hypothetical protein
MIDIVTVVFKDELPVLKVQAQSIDLFCREMDLGQIYVIVNDTELLEIDISWWGQFSDRVIIINRSLWNISYADNGWLTQQLLKMLGSTNSNNEWTMILDAKTILVQSVDLKRIFNSNQLTWGYFPIAPVFERAKKIVSDLFKIDQINVAGPSGVPFFFHNTTVREMIKEVEKITGRSFVKWFQEQGMVTEFILYSGYIQYRDGTLDKMYIKNSTLRYSCCNIAHYEVDEFDEKYLTMLNDQNLTVSIHRSAWNQLGDIQKATYRNLLNLKGITRSKDLL